MARSGTTTMVTMAALVASALLGTASGFSGSWGGVHRGGVVARARGLPTVAAVVARRSRPSMSMMAEATDQGSAYAQCSKCKAAYVVDIDAMGKGKKVTCSVCQHSWWQSTERLQTLRDGFTMKEFPDDQIEAVKKNLSEGREARSGPPKKKGAITLFCGNLPFTYVDNDIIELFKPHGEVASVSLVRAPDGRSRGFCFIDFVKKEDGEKAMEEMNGYELDGRSLNVALGGSKN